MEFNPPADLTLREGDVLIGVGSQDQIERFRKLVR